MTQPQFVPKGQICRNLEEKLQLETRNVVIQAEFIFYTSSNWSSEKRINPALVLKLQELAINQIYRCAGYFRDGPVSLEGPECIHQPPEHAHVPELVEEMCAYIEDHWGDRQAIHLAAYAVADQLDTSLFRR